MTRLKRDADDLHARGFGVQPFASLGLVTSFDATLDENVGKKLCDQFARCRFLHLDREIHGRKSGDDFGALGSGCDRPQQSLARGIVC